MDFKLETEFSKIDILQEVDALKKQIHDKRPLSQEIEGRVMQKLRLDWNYNSNAIEGNKLNYGETTALLMHGITAKGKPLKDHLDIQGHNDAINFLQSIVKEDRPFSEADIRELHMITLVEPYTVTAQTDDGKSTTKQIKLGVYKSSPNHVKTITGELHYYATPEETPAKMQELMEWYNAISNDKAVHPAVIAALFHHRFTEIHPFDDGNGRLARILMNLILMKSGYPPVVIKMDDRQNYYSLLSQADVANRWPFVEYIVELLRSSLNVYIKAINGGDIDEDEDIDKNIALFKMEMQSKVHLKEKKSIHRVKEIFIKDLLSLFREILLKVSTIDDLFFKKHSTIIFTYSGKKKNVIDHTYSDQEINFSEDDLFEILEFINREDKEILEIILRIDYIEFKNSDNIFSIRNTIAIGFDIYKYIISTDKSQRFTKFYNESLTENEKKEIVKSFVENVMQIIRNQTKSPKSN